MERLDKIIKDYKNHPENYGENVWWCYTSCKKEINKMQDDGEVGTDCDSYNRCIKYVTDKLEI